MDIEKKKNTWWYTDAFLGEVHSNLYKLKQTCFQDYLIRLRCNKCKRYCKGIYTKENLVSSCCNVSNTIKEVSVL